MPIVLHMSKGLEHQILGLYIADKLHSKGPIKHQPEGHFPFV